MILKFCSRTARDVQKTRQFSIRLAPGSFRDVRANGSRGTTHLGRYSEQLFFRELARGFVHINRQRMGL
jgi:hypothetical protein